MSIGLGIITCNREDFFRKCIKSVANHPQINEIVIVNDGTPYQNDAYIYGEETHLIQHKTNQGVGISKNHAFEHLIERQCDHIFIMEDDIVVRNPLVFREYIRTAETTGIGHLMYGYHGPANKVGGKPHARAVVMYDQNTGLALNQHCVGAFCYYSAKSLLQTGLFDQKFLNAFEHVEHTYQLWREKFTTPFWWFADVYNSYEYLDELACSEVSSVIRPRADWQSNIQKAYQYYYEKHGMYPTQTPDHTLEQVREFLKNRYEAKIREKEFAKNMICVNTAKQ